MQRPWDGSIRRRAHFVAKLVRRPPSGSGIRRRDLQDRRGQPEVAQDDQRDGQTASGSAPNNWGEAPEGASAWQECEQGDPCASVIEKIRSEMENTD